MGGARLDTAPSTCAKLWKSSPCTESPTKRIDRPAHRVQKAHASAARSGSTLRCFRRSAQPSPSGSQVKSSDGRAGRDAGMDWFVWRSVSQRPHHFSSRRPPCHAGSIRYGSVAPGSSGTHWPVPATRQRAAELWRRPSSPPPAASQSAPSLHARAVRAARWCGSMPADRRPPRRPGERTQECASLRPCSRPRHLPSTQPRTAKLAQRLKQA